MLTIDDLKTQNMLVLECISGSRAYGLATPTSDTDIKGVYVLPKHLYYSLDYVPQVSNDTNDEVYYELNRFLELLAANNPNILELLNTPEDSVLYKHPLMAQVKPELFLSKLCQKTFGQFAISQIKKATGLNKKIMNPMDKEHKSLLAFCYIANTTDMNGGSMPLTKWLEGKGWNAEHCGLVKLDHMRDVYALYYNPSENFNGIISKQSNGQVVLSTIPKGEPQQAVLYVNAQGYSAYFKDYKAYWHWVENRNQERYKTNVSHGNNYDTKNMMHVFRLLEMAIEIGEQSQVNVKRPNRDFLLSIKQGEFEYDALMEMATERQQQLEKAFEKSALPERPNIEKINTLAYQLREHYYL